MRMMRYGAFGWYVKTEHGVIGIVRIDWEYENSTTHRVYYDDAYYVIRQGEAEYMAAERDVLLEMLGEYENVNIYTGKYNENGKLMPRFYIN